MGAAEDAIAAIDDGGANIAAEVRTMGTEILARADSQGCAVTLLAAQTGISTPAAAVLFDDELWDDDDWHDPTVNPSRITPGAAGRFHVEGVIGVDNAVVNQEHRYSVYVNGVEVAVFALFKVGNAEFSRSFALELELALATDYIELFVERTAGSGTFDVKATPLWLRFQVSQV